jgi:hypothetical protein
MAFNPAPTQIIASWSEDATNVTFPIASVSELTAAEADASTGDSRKVVYALLEKLHAWYTALAVGDRPGKLTVNRGSTVNEITGEITRNYYIQIVTTPSGIEVSDE